MHRRAEVRKQLYRDGVRAALLGIGVNVVLGAAKLAAGLVGDSFALVADSVNSLGDVVASLIVLAALWVAQRPADVEHPYGHAKAEAVAATNVALIVVLSALIVGWTAIQRLLMADMAQPAPWTLWVAVATVVVKEGLYRYKRRVAGETGSSALLANAWDHRGDALASLAVVLGIAAVQVGGPELAWADEAAAFVVALAVAWTGSLLFRRAASELMDRQAPASLVADVRRVACGVPGVEDVETLRLRSAGIEYFADIHLEVDPDLSVAEGHALGHRVKDRLLERFPSVRDVLVHVEPH